jgi:hypothetical protein
MTKYTCFAFSVAASLFAGLASGTRADQTNQSVPATGTNRPPTLEQWNTLTPEQRAAKIQELRRMHGYTNSAVQLTPEQRRARIQKRLEELRRKQAEGTLTPVETKQLELLQRSTNHPLPSLRLLQTNSVHRAGTTNFNLLSK